MSRISLTICLACFLLMSACSVILPKRDATNIQIDQWIAQHKYSKALKALNIRARTQPSTANASWLQTVQELAANYDLQETSQIQYFADKGNLDDAFQRLDLALQNYPEGAHLLELQNRLKPKQAQRVEELESQLILARAEWLLNSKSLNEEIIRVYPENKRASNELKIINPEINTNAEKLSKIGIKFLGANKLDLADRYLTMADQLHPSKGNIAALVKLDQLRYELKTKLRKQQLKAQEARNKIELKKRKQVLQQKELRQQREIKHLVTNIQKALNKEDLFLAQKLFVQLVAIDVKDPNVPKLQQILNDAITTKVDKLLDQGNVLYRNGEILQAKETWEKALKINPDNTQVRSRIIRAERVLNKLRELQGKNTAPD